MYSMRSEGSHYFIPDTVENRKRFLLYFHKLTQTKYSAALILMLNEARFY
jgi:hypothetical protein